MRLKISAVEYLNSYPLYKTLDSSIFEISLDYPAVCSKKLADGLVDIGLIPIMGYRNSYFIIPDIAIGSDSRVKSVLLMLNKPIEHCNTISISPHSVSSNIIVQIIAKEFLKAEQLKFGSFDKPDGKIVIGDEALKIYKQGNSIIYDVAKLWKHYTGLPTVFAFWASNKVIPGKIMKLLSKAKQDGIDQISRFAREFSIENRYADVDFFEDYLRNSICYALDKAQKQAIELEYELAYKYGLIGKMKPKFL